MSLAKPRLQSLDAFRGFTIMGMILVNNPGDWNNTYGQLLHAKWHGWTFTDWIFPFFLFISGMSMVISTGQNSQNRAGVCLQLLKRALIIFLLGLMLNWIPNFDLATIRVPGVLQRIALCVALAAPLVVYGHWKSQALAALVVMLVYSVLMLMVSVPDASGAINTGVLEAGKDTGAYLDRLLLSGHLWASAKTWDPEGLLSTLPALASLLLGCLTSHWLKHAAKSPDSNRTLMGLMVGGAFFLVLGQIMAAYFMPINKPIWTPSYAVFMTGVALIVFAWFYWAIDIARWVNCKPLVMMGMNALFLFVLSSLIAKTLNAVKLTNSQGQMVNLKQYLFVPLKSLGLSANNTSLLFAIGFCAVMFAIGYWMYQRRWFIKV
jgi:predicted acyltransferase